MSARVTGNGAMDRGSLFLQRQTTDSTRSRKMSPTDSTRSRNGNFNFSYGFDAFAKNFLRSSKSSK